jgi:Resolvase, N terminal domain
LRRGALNPQDEPHRRAAAQILTRSASAALSVRHRHLVLALEGQVPDQGYGRVSSTDQALAVQREALGRTGVNVIFEEKASGTKRDGRTELQKVLSILGGGDALVVTRLDRLGRSLRDLANIAHEIEQAGAHLEVIEQNVDTSSAAGRAFFWHAGSLRGI